MFYLNSRSVLKISGGINVLQGIFTSDIKSISNFTFSAMLNSKGRFLFDFFIFKTQDGFLIDIRTEWVEKFIKAVKHYDLLEEISITKTDLKVFAYKHFLTNWKKGVFEGRIISKELEEKFETEEEYNIARIKLCLPDGFLELVPEKSIILDYGYDEAHGISFNKGCYTGQELMNRTKRVGEVRKALFCIYAEDGNFANLEDVLSSFGKYALIKGYKSDLKVGTSFEIKGGKFQVTSSSGS
jgi:folate-binding protein YgfZ